MDETPRKTSRFDGPDNDQACPPTEGQSHPRVLFVSVNPFSNTSNNGKTFASFFQAYPIHSIAQLYFHREIPSSPVCNRYFRITDEALLRNALRPWRVSGERVTGNSDSFTTIPHRTHSALKASPSARLVRQLLWTGVRLESAELIRWLDEFQPEIVFFCGGDAAYLYPKVYRLANRYGAKLVFYITDDYVLPIRSRNVASQAIRWWTRFEFARLARRADLILTIGELMSRVYEREFGIATLPFMNMVTVPPLKPPPRTRPETPEPLRLLYAGSLHSNRWRTLARLIDSIQNLSESGTSIRLCIYGPEPTDDISATLHRPPYARHRGMLSPAELNAAIARADVLVHVESDDPASMASTALSISTKIPEYLASGRPILAIGPQNLASIEYLSRHQAAIVVEPPDTAGLDKALSDLSSNPNLCKALSDRAHALALASHDGTSARQLLWDRLGGLLRGER